MVGIDSIVELALPDRICRINPSNQLPVHSGRLTSPVKQKDKEKVEIKRAKVTEHPYTGTSTPLPEEYVKFQGNEFGTHVDIEYDVDDEDAEWLRMVNERRSKEKLKPISEEDLEKAIDLFEKASFFQSETRFAATDEDAPCCICNDGETTNTNQIIFCDMCNMAVHQECYGVPYIPAGQWLCRRCQLSPSQPVKCCLCPYSNGAFKQTADNRWVHVVCALWLSEVHFANVVFLEPVEGVNQSLKRRAKLTCQVCKIKTGACLQCSKRCCVRPFHVTCAIFSDMHMRVEHDLKDDSVKREAYCHIHSVPFTKNADLTQAAFKRSVSEKVKKARRILQSSAKQTNHVPVPKIPNDKLADIKENLSLEKLDDVLNYWSLKRRARCGVPLLRRLQVYHSKKQLGRRSNDFFDESALLDPSNPQSDQLLRTGKLRNNLEKLRLLVELIKKREKFKLEVIQNYRQIVESTMKPLRVILEDTLNKMIEKDHQFVFTQPVSDADVPGYSKIIKKPMDFTKMRAKVKNNEYRRVHDLKLDFDLMLDNCAEFNRNNPYFLRYGHVIRSLGIKILKNAEFEEQNMGSTKFMQDFPFLFTNVSYKDEHQAFENEPSTSRNTPQNTATDNRHKRKHSGIKFSPPKKFRDTKISDFFKPITTLGSSPRSPDSKKRRTTSPTQKVRITKNEYVTETSSASDTGGFTSTDEEHPKRSRLKNRNAQKDVGADPFAHNDIVWAPYKHAKDRLPARFLNRALVPFEAEKHIQDKVRSLKPHKPDDLVALVMFFDANETVAEVPASQLQLCDVLKRNPAEGAQAAAAMRRAKEFWDKTME